MRTQLVGILLCGVLAQSATQGGQVALLASSGETAPTARGEWLVPASRAEVLKAVDATLASLGLRVDVRRQEYGIVVTRLDRYRPEWPTAEALGLPSIHTPTRAEFHVFVPPDFEPARLVVGAVLVTETTHVPAKRAKSKGASTFYNQRVLGEFLATRIVERLGVPLTPLSADPAERTRQSIALAKSGRVRPCGDRVPTLLDSNSTAVPVVRHVVKPDYPATELNRGLGGTVGLRGQVTEHGTIATLEWVSGVEEANLVAATTGAAALWRFSPAVVDGCPALRTVVFEMSYGIRR